jgi:hypothetical protein
VCAAGKGQLTSALVSRCTEALISSSRGGCRDFFDVIVKHMRRNGASLVLRSANGTAFTGAPFKSTLARLGVAHLRLSRALLQYNGACAAGIGVL